MNNVSEIGIVADGDYTASCFWIEGKMFHVFGKFDNGAKFFGRFGEFFVGHFVEIWEVDGKDHRFDFFAIIFEKFFDCGLDLEITLIGLFDE